MSDKLFIKETFVDLSDIDFSHVVCPACGSSEQMSLKGYLMTPYEETYEGDLVTKKEVNSEKAFDLKQILCLSCCTKSLITDPIIFAYQKVNSNLLDQLREATGHPSLKN